jgi:DDE superfamily endonuclease
MQTSPPLAARAQKLEQLQDFRAGFYDCLPSWGDALFELTDAALCAPGPISSVPSLSLDPTFRRSHGSLYKALSKGEIDAEQIRELLSLFRPTDWPLVFAVDASTWPRSDAETSPGRGFYHSPSRHSAGQPIVAGWNYQWITQLNFAPDSWTAPLDAMRIPPDADTTTATIDQIRRQANALPADGPVPLFALDAGYDPAGLTHGLADTRAQILVRLSSNRVFYTDPPPATTAPTTAGRPRRHGRRFKLSDERSAPKPDIQTSLDDPRYGKVRIRAWHNLHPRLSKRGRWAKTSLPPIVRGTVIRVDVQRLPKPSSRANNKTLWLWWAGPGQPDLELCLHAYLHRFDLEHTYRFAKNTLGWTTPSVRTPEQADRWTWLTVAAYTQLRLARGIIDDIRLPWQRPRDPDNLTPARVRRGFPRLRPTIGSPANPPKSQKPGPGRPKGTTRPPRTRYPVIKKTA